MTSTDLGTFGCGSTSNTEGQFWVLNGPPQVVGGFAGASGTAKYFTANVTPPAPGTFNLQPSVRDSVYGPGFQVWNLMLFKTFTVTERSAFEFRAEAYDSRITRTGRTLARQEVRTLRRPLPPSVK